MQATENRARTTAQGLDARSLKRHATRKHVKFDVACSFSKRSSYGLWSRSPKLPPLALEKVLRVPVHFWLNMEASYREHLARVEEQACLATKSSRES